MSVCDLDLDGVWGQYPLLSEVVLEPRNEVDGPSSKLLRFKPGLTNLELPLGDPGAPESVADWRGRKVDGKLAGKLALLFGNSRGTIFVRTIEVEAESVIRLTYERQSERDDGAKAGQLRLLIRANIGIPQVRALEDVKAAVSFSRASDARYTLALFELKHLPARLGNSLVALEPS